MNHAVIKDINKLISINQFKRKYGSKSVKEGLELICPACKGVVHVYGINSTKVAAKFHHAPGSDCLYLHDRGNYLSLPKAWNIEKGTRIRNLLKDKEFIKKLYCFCLNLCGSESLPVDKFLNLIKKADMRNLWSCSGFKEWMIGFLLLVQEDFEGKDSRDNQYTFRFFLQKNEDAGDALEKAKRKFNIEKVLRGEGYLLVKAFESSKTKDFIPSNPYAVCEESWEDFSRDYQWAYEHQGENLVTKVKELRKL